MSFTHTMLSNREQALVDRLFQLSPQVGSVLDVGCGAGNIIKHLSKLDVTAVGIDSHEATIQQLKNEGIVATIGEATKLEFEDNSFEWVILSGVLHHLPNSKQAMDEAIRVARHGVMIGEPWFDQTVRCHRLAAELDAWAKKLHQSLGFYHRTGLSAGEIIELISSEDVKNIVAYYETYFEEEDLDEWFENQEQYTKQLPKNHVIAWEGRVLKEKMGTQFLCKNGWVIVALTL